MNVLELAFFALMIEMNRLPLTFSSFGRGAKANAKSLVISVADISYRSGR